MDEGHTIDLSDRRSRVVTHGMTPRGLRVSLVPWEKDLSPETPSPYEDWPEGEREMPPGLGRLLVEVTDAAGIEAIVGMVSWHRESYGPTSGSHAWNIGIGLIEAVRGHGIGSVAQRLLAEWLLETTYVDRIEASTDVENLAEQKSLERAGFTQEGILRSAQERADGRHDLVGYSFIREDLDART